MATEQLRRTYTSIDRHDQTSDPSSLVTAEKQDGLRICQRNTISFGEMRTVSDVPCCSFNLHQVLIDPRLPHLVGHASTTDHGRICHARTHAVDSDVLWAMLSSHCPRHLHDGTLRRRIKQTWISSLY